MTIRVRAKCQSGPFKVPRKVPCNVRSTGPHVTLLLRDIRRRILSGWFCDGTACDSTCRRPRRSEPPSRLAAAAAARALDDFLGAAVAGAGGARHRGSGFSWPCPGSGCGCGCRRSAAPRVWSCSRRHALWAVSPFYRLRLPGIARRVAPARSRQRPAPPAGDRDRRRARGDVARIPIRSRCGMRMSSARCKRARALKSRRAVAARRLARSLCVARARADRLRSRPSSPPAANAGTASPRRSIGRAWCCRRISASTPG